MNSAKRALEAPLTAKRARQGTTSPHLGIVRNVRARVLSARGLLRAVRRAFSAFMNKTPNAWHVTHGAHNAVVPVTRSARPAPLAITNLLLITKPASLVMCRVDPAHL